MISSQLCYIVKIPMSDDIQEPVEEAEIVEEALQEVPAEEEVVTEGAEAAQSQIDLESMIHKYLKDMEQTREKLKMQKSMLEDAFQNDAGYAEAASKVKEATKARNAVKQKIQNQAAVKKVVGEVNSLKEEMKDLQEGLSLYLRQYQEKTGTTYFTGEDGEVMEIVIMRKLVKKSSKN